MSQTKNQTRQVRIRYAETSALYASQFLVNATGEDVVLSFSSGYLSDPASGETLLPVHTRIAMSVAGARRLHALLDQILKKPSNTPAGGVGENLPEPARARLPKADGKQK